MNYILLKFDFMEYESILQKIITLAGEQFPDEKEKIEGQTTATDISAWNSLSHVMLIDRIEKSFGVKFELLQMVDMLSIENIARATHEMLR